MAGRQVPEDVVASIFTVVDAERSAVCWQILGRGWRGNKEDQ